MIWRLLLFELVLLLVIAGVWLGAPLIGIESVLWRLVIIFALVLPPIAVLIWTLWSRRRAARNLESAMTEQGKEHKETVRPDRREEIEALNDAFSQAVGALRRSKLSSGRGTALYAMPWYMIIGPPAAGKSTALLRSGLKFPFTPGERKAIKGVGGTRNCDWWFSDQAILLDTAGRYATEDDDQDEWLAFLRMLRKYRKKRPLNGLLVAISIAELLQAKPDELEEQAAQVRSRIDQVIKELDLALPIYVLFTKCDLISGFVEFFGDLKKRARQQVWGFTVQPTDNKSDIEEIFNTEFDALLERLRERGMIRLASARSHQRTQVFQFPLQFATARDPLAAFTSMLLVSNPYQEAPRLRGVYFCSGTQEGRPLDRVMAMMGRALGLRGLAAGNLQERSQKKSYFLRDVFTEVLIPDKQLAGTTVAGLRRRRRLGLAGLALSMLGAASIAGLWAMTFAGNYRLVKSTTHLARTSRLTTPEDPRKVAGSLEALDELGRRVDELHKYKEDDEPFSLGFGFYQGEALREPALRLYVKRMRQAFVLPAGSELEATLIDIGNSSDATSKGAEKDFDLLKTYLMVTNPKRLKVDYAANVLLGQWKKRLHPDVSQRTDLLKRNAKRYLLLLKRRKAGWLERDNTVVRNVRHALRARDAEYRRILGNAEKELRPFTLRDALRGRVQSIIKAEHTVPGVYTRRGWITYMRKRIAKQMARGSTLEPWVLGEEGTKDVSSRLRDRYFEQYIAAWMRFLRGLSVELPGTAKESLRMLEKLTEQPPLYKELLEAVAFNAELPLVGGSADKGDGPKIHLRGRVGQIAHRARQMGLDKIAKKALKKKRIKSVFRAFLPLRELVIPPKGIDGRAQLAGIRQYQDQIDAVRDSLQKELQGNAPPPGSAEGGLEAKLSEARRVTKGVLASLPGSLRRPVGTLFYAPLDSAAGNAKVAQADRSSRQFSNELCAPYKERLAKKFPFARSSRSEALIQDVVEYFSPTGTVWSYYDRRLKSRLPRRGDSFEPAADAKVPTHIVSFINRAWRITRALFPLGKKNEPRLRFEVRPRPAILGSGADYQISEVILEVEGKKKTYRNGPIEQWSFTWTGQGKRSRLLVRGAGGLREEISYRGDWSLLRLFRRAKARKRGSWYRVHWRFKGGKITIPMDVRPARSYNPLFGRLSISCK